jgi:hypothetical protein
MKFIKIAIVISILAIVMDFGYQVVAEKGDYATLGYNMSGKYSFWRVNSSGDFIPGAASTYKIGNATYKVASVYTDYVSMTGAIKLYSKTKTEIAAITPASVGEIYYCSNCSVPVCISTGTDAGDFSAITSSTTACS